MPRQGDGSSDNYIELGHDIIHGAGQEPVSVTLSSLYYLPLDKRPTQNPRLPASHAPTRPPPFPSPSTVSLSRDCMLLEVRARVSPGVLNQDRVMALSMVPRSSDWV
ncbi:hypothetical protein B0H65DRAFT_451337 [Neurospora tetraspora]|uniref:Uncharacterized protein n=1 Tax=Neurospora tetraspora TaxID=94610 RepID=A0AAE0MW84_9PEZI|nr:hypothetical protein B0H65DRAFT_451337 [Neurospora tetraspora]